MLYQFFLILTVGLSFITYAIAPLKYNLSFCNGCTIIFFIGVFCFFKLKNKTNYFDFDTLFILSSYFIFFFFPTIVFPISSYNESILLFPFNSKFISKGTALAVVGMTSYLLGSCTYSRKKTGSRPQLLDSKPVAYVSIFCFLGYIICGGWDNLRKAYANQSYSTSGPSNYLLILASITIIVTIVLWYNKMVLTTQKRFDIKLIPYNQIVFALFIVGMMLVTGSRTLPLQIVLCFIGLYTFYYRAIPFFKVAVFFFAGICVMFIVLFLRSGGSSITADQDSPYMVALDLFINSRNTYAALDYTATHNITYGTSMLAPILSVIPFLQNIVFTFANISPSYTSSPNLLTLDALGEGSKVGVGTNIIADLYLAFGLFGVFIGMFIFGRFIALLKFRAQDNIYSLYCYSVLLSLSIYIVRAEILYFLRSITWGILIIYLLRIYENRINIQDEHCDIC